MADDPASQRRTASSSEHHSRVVVIIFIVRAYPALNSENNYKLRKKPVDQTGGRGSIAATTTSFNDLDGRAWAGLLRSVPGPADSPRLGGRPSEIVRRSPCRTYAHVSTLSPLRGRSTLTLVGLAGFEPATYPAALGSRLDRSGRATSCATARLPLTPGRDSRDGSEELGVETRGLDEALALVAVSLGAHDRLHVRVATAERPSAALDLLPHVVLCPRVAAVSHLFSPPCMDRMCVAELNNNNLTMCICQQYLSRTRGCPYSCRRIGRCLENQAP